MIPKTSRASSLVSKVDDVDEEGLLRPEERSCLDPGTGAGGELGPVTLLGLVLRPCLCDSSVSSSSISVSGCLRLSPDAWGLSQIGLILDGLCVSVADVVVESIVGVGAVEVIVGLGLGGSSGSSAALGLGGGAGGSVVLGLGGSLGSSAVLGFGGGAGGSVALGLGGGAGGVGDLGAIAARLSFEEGCCK